MIDVVEKAEEIRKEEDMTVEDVCSEIGVSVSSYRRWRRGGTKPRLEHYVELLDFLEEYDGEK